ncbi:MAG TPA: YbhN family protein [Iamia sp.]|nr:YbhN family protein [Iamia sp.]
MPTRSQRAGRSWETAGIGAIPPPDPDRRAPRQDDAADRGPDGARPADGENEGLLGTNVTAEMLKVTGTKTLKRTPLIILFFLVFNNFVLPTLSNVDEAISELSAVSPFLLVLALGLEGAALVAYAQLTRVTLPPQPRLDLVSVLRIQLSTKAVTNVVPGGSAAGGTLGYRLLTQAGVDSASAGFSMATVGLGSAIVLNLLLWVALLISIPLDGFNPVYGTAAIAGMVLMAAVAAGVALMLKGRDTAVRVVRAVARRVPFLDPDTAERFVRNLVGRLAELLDNPTLLRRGVTWAAVNWLLDAAALWVFIRAFGPVLNPVDVIVAFCLANILAVIPITPGGLGIIEYTLISTLVGFGLANSEATAAVITYRIAQFWLPIPLGAVSYATLRLGPTSLRKIRSRHPLRELAGDTAGLAQVRVWDVDEPRGD